MSLHDTIYIHSDSKRLINYFLKSTVCTVRPYALTGKTHACNTIRYICYVQRIAAAEGALCDSFMVGRNESRSNGRLRASGPKIDESKVSVDMFTCAVCGRRPDDTLPPTRLRDEDDDRDVRLKQRRGGGTVAHDGGGSRTP
eukprot:m.25371 g.25371  ORF g.25371 m.25371 type:complete len:142 (+) comp28795_c0_seq1:7296-7721(+)